MLISAIRGLLSGDFSAIIEIVVMFPIIMFSLSFHEFAHGFTAYKLGDPTAKYKGRLSLNPLHHLDPIGTVMMFLFGFGWAKPVPINPSFFKNRKRGMMLTALAGPLSNLLLAFVSMFIQHVVATVVINVSYVSLYSTWYIVLSLFLSLIISLNIGLAVFNLIPLPPLDGSRILNIFLPEKYYFRVMQYERYIYIALIIAVGFGILSYPISFIADAVYKGMFYIIGLIPGLY